MIGLALRFLRLRSMATSERDRVIVNRRWRRTLFVPAFKRLRKLGAEVFTVLTLLRPKGNVDLYFFTTLCLA
jgi:hypothetical protein